MNKDIWDELLEKLHTTQLGALRIKRNLDLVMLEDEVLLWCYHEIYHAEESIRKGKNWYIKKDHVTYTVNASNFCIITAHRNKKIQPNK